MTNWIDRVRAIIRQNLSWSPITEQQKEAVIDDEIARIEVLDAILEADKSAEEEDDDPITSKGEKLSDLLARARREYEPWLR